MPAPEQGRVCAPVQGQGTPRGDAEREQGSGLSDSDRDHSGYGRAARMIDWMAADGVVGDYNGQHAREVICTMEQWQSARADRD